MSIPVIFYMFLNSFAPLVLNDQFLTTLIFNEEIVSPHTGASSSEIYLKKSPNSKMLFIKSKGKALKTNLTVPTVSGKLYSFFIITGDLPHSIVQVRDGKKGKAFRDVKISQNVIIQESSSMAQVQNISKKIISINFRKLSPGHSLQLPKGAPVFINNKRTYR